MSKVEPVAWTNKDNTYVELSTHSTVYGSHTIPLYTVNAVDTMMKELEQQLDVAREFCRQYQIENKQLKAENLQLKNVVGAMDDIITTPDNQIKVMLYDTLQERDELKTQLAIAHEMYYNSETYKQNIKFSVDMIK